MNNPSDAIALALSLDDDTYEALLQAANEDLSIALLEGETYITDTKFGILRVESVGDGFLFTTPSGSSFRALVLGKAQNFLIGAYEVETA